MGINSKFDVTGYYNEERAWRIWQNARFLMEALNAEGIRASALATDKQECINEFIKASVYSLIFVYSGIAS